MMASQTRALARGRFRVAAVVATSGLVAGMALLGAPASRAAAPGSPQCNATGGAITSTAGENLGGNFVHTFTGNGTFTPKQTMNIDYLVVGGGGGGGGATTSRAGGGGGAGEFITASGVSVTANTAYTITVGGGGAGGATSTSRGTAGTASSIGTLGITAAGGGGGAAGTTNTTGLAVTNGESAGGGGGASSGTVTGGSATAPGGAGGNGRASGITSRPAGGGGGGDTSNGVSSPSNGRGGNGGTGTASSISGASVTYAAGGGGGGRSTAGLGTTGVSGNGGLALAGVAAPANRGGGGGGAGNTSTAATTLAGGAGGSGIVIIRYTKNAGCPTQPQTPAFSSPTFSWTAPATIPAGQTISQYTVIYKQAGDTTLGNIYARSTSGSTLSINVLGTTQGACTTNNPSGWTCNSTIALTSGQTYQFQVFARTSTAGLSKVSTAVSVAIP